MTRAHRPRSAESPPAPRPGGVRRSLAQRTGMVAVAGLLASGGCDQATAPTLERVAITPPALYGVWWDEMTACSGEVGSREGVSWFVTYEFPEGGSVLGQWNSRREITVRSDVWLEREVVAHEILHDLLRGDLEHEDPAWQICGIPVGVDVR